MERIMRQKDKMYSDSSNRFKSRYLTEMKWKIVAQRTKSMSVPWINLSWWLRHVLLYFTLLYFTLGIGNSYFDDLSLLTFFGHIFPTTYIVYGMYTTSTLRLPPHCTPHFPSTVSCNTAHNIHPTTSTQHTHHRHRYRHRTHLTSLPYTPHHFINTPYNQRHRHCTSFWPTTTHSTPFYYLHTALHTTPSHSILQH